MINFLGRAVMFYVFLMVVTTLVVWIGPGFHEVKGQMVFLFVLAAGVPASFKAAREIRF